MGIMQPRTASANYSAGITLLWQGVCTPGYQSLRSSQFGLPSIFCGPCLVVRLQPVVIKTQALLVEKLTSRSMFSWVLVFSGIPSTLS